MCGVGRDKVDVWGYYFSELRRPSGFGFDVDYSAFDGSAGGVLFDFFQHVTDRFYSKSTTEERNARHALLSSIKRAFVIVGPNLIRTEQGNKSGCAMTDVLNSVMNVFVVCMSYLHGRLIKGLSPNFDNFDNDVRVVTYGDDVIVGADLATLSYFNRDTIREIATHLGMKVTSAAKTGEFIPFEPIVNLSFLKSGFRNVDGVVFPTYPEDVIHKQLLWTRKGNLGDARIQRDIIKGALEFAAYRGPEYLDKTMRELRAVGRKDKLHYADAYMYVKERQENHVNTVVESLEFDDFD